jgi:hypothetical protein
MHEYDGGMQRKRCPECLDLLEEDAYGDLTVCPTCAGHGPDDPADDFDGDDDE